MVGIFAMVGCVYKAPLAKKQKIKIDNAVVGLWQTADKAAEAAGAAGRLLVLEYTDSEYLVCYQDAKGSMYFRGYPIKVEGISCVQLQLVGNADGSVKAEDRKYQVVTYALAADALEVRILNGDVVSADLGTTEELKDAFTKNKDNEKLFSNPVKFVKVQAAK